MAYFTAPVEMYLYLMCFSQVHINYIEIMDPRLIRRQSLKSQYRFDCCCRRCEDPSDASLENSLRCGQWEGRAAQVKSSWKFSGGGA